MKREGSEVFFFLVSSLFNTKAKRKKKRNSFRPFERPAGEDGDKDNSSLLFGFGPSSAPIGLREEKERPLSSVADAALWDEEQKRGGKVEVGARVDMWREEEEWEGK